MKLDAFQGAEHQPFTLPGKVPGKASTAILMVHGFPGTPAELRPLAEFLHCLPGAGLTIDVPLLPGFGDQIATLPTRSADEWIGAVDESITRLGRSHERVIVVGFSMGAALALRATANRPDHAAPSSLVLLAPFWQLGEDWQQPLWPLIRLFMREFRPFARANFNDPATRRDLLRSMPTADLDDAATQEAIRQISFPFSVIDQLRQLGRTTWKIAPLIKSPVTVIQGQQDPIVPPVRTRRLIERFAQPVAYVEVEGDHQLIQPNGPAWDQVTTTIVNCLQTGSTR